MNRSEHERDVEPGSVDALLASARRSFEARAWSDARASFLAAEAVAPLSIDDLERLALAASLVSDLELMLKTFERVHHRCVQEGHELRAVRAGFWLGFRLMPLERARGQAWLARVQRILDGVEGACVERGYVLLPATIMKIVADELDTADGFATEALGIGEQFADRDLIAFARMLQGRVLLRRAQVERGLSLFDDAMLAAISNELSPTVTGLIYCHVIAGCTQVYAFDRAREWTSALTEWCDAQPQLRTFAGTCLVHRAELMELGGDWSDAIETARSVADRASAAHEPIVAAGAAYQQAEIHRLRGEQTEAEAAYAESARGGREPLPGLALLRLAQGNAEAAASAMRRVISAATGAMQRTHYLPAHVEVMLAIGALDEARRACDELDAISTQYEGEILCAIAKHSRAALQLAEGNAQAVLEPLRDALQVWQRIGAPYIAARIHVLLARACEALGDDDGARLERRCAREAFEQLGAAPDLAALGAADAPTGSVRPKSKAPHGLTTRELQVLLLVAAGKTNRAIATELFLSEKTVDRHVSNIFAKLEVPSRAAATAYAYEHGLI